MGYMTKKKRKKDKKKKQPEIKNGKYVYRMLSPLKILFDDFIMFFRNDFHPAAYIYTIVVTALSILLIYGTDLGKTISSKAFPTSSAVINNMLIFVVMYFLVAVPTTIMRGTFCGISKPVFFARGLLLMCLIGFTYAFSWNEALDLSKFSQLEQSYILGVLW